MLGSLASERKRYTQPGPVTLAFLRSTARVVGIMGPQGGGKTTAVINRILLKAASQPPSPLDGIARYRCTIWMRTYRELWAKVIPDWLDWIPKQSKAWNIEWQGGVDNPAEQSFRFRSVQNGVEKICQAKVMFRAVGDQTPGEAAKGIHTTDGWLPEATSADAEMRKALFGRLGRYPSREHGGAPERQLFCDWNAGDPYNWTTIFFITDLGMDLDADGRRMVEFFRQPGGREPGAENLHNLPVGYYDDQIAANRDDPDWIRRMVDNRIGFMRDGLPVYGGFDEARHVAPTELRPWPGHPLIIAADGGLTPAAVIMQRSDRGETRVLAELAFQRADAKTFGQALMVLLDSPRFAQCPRPTQMWADPATLNATESSGRDTETDQLLSWASIVAKETGLRVSPSRCGNDLTMRVTSTSQMIERQIGGRPAFVVDQTHCPELFKGLVRDYRYEKVQSVNRNGAIEYRDKPTKNFASHVCNALEYAAANAGEQDIVTGKAERKAKAAAARAAQARAGAQGPTDPLRNYRARA